MKVLRQVMMETRLMRKGRRQRRRVRIRACLAVWPLDLRFMQLHIFLTYE